MGYEAKVLADSVSPDRHRLITLQVTLPRIVLAELNTHRDFSRNSASSRAIPVEKMLARVTTDPFVPIYWGKNQKGMQAEEELTEDEQKAAEKEWLHARDLALVSAKALLAMGVHKQITNRLLEPFLWHTVIISSTQWDNALNLRRHKDAQPEIRRAFEMIGDVIQSSWPEYLSPKEWHLPLVRGVDEETLRIEGYGDAGLAKISCGRCARVSYLTHDGRRDPREDIALVDERLVPSGHMSPLEHAARPMTQEELARYRKPTFHLLEDAKPPYFTHFLGNFNGWVQYRKLIPGENVFKGEKA